MGRVGDASPVTRALIWLGAVVASGVAGLIAVGATYDEFLDCSNPDIHESANTTLGWMVALAASAVPVAVAIALAGGLRRRLSLVAVAVGLVSVGVWSWLLDADCEWYAAVPLLP